MSGKELNDEVIEKDACMVFEKLLITDSKPQAKVTLFTQMNHGTLNTKEFQDANEAMSIGEILNDDTAMNKRDAHDENEAMNEKETINIKETHDESEAMNIREAYDENEAMRGIAIRRMK
ncbi:unnamed protein product [Rhizopus stolonifer]